LKYDKLSGKFMQNQDDFSFDEDYQWDTNFWKDSC
jgi:hypothetical protein